MGLFSPLRALFDCPLHSTLFSFRIARAEEKPSSSPLSWSPYALADAAEAALPAVVRITVSETARGRYRREKEGSGFIIDPSGTVVTNAHVVSSTSVYGANVSNPVVTMHDGSQYAAAIQFMDRSADIAVLQIERKHATQSFPHLRLGDSSKVRAGEFVIALGSPHRLFNTVTAGIVSNSGRRAGEINENAFQNMSYIQTDCPITHGNSGGPLINVRGEVIGVNTLKLSTYGVDSGSIGFAISINFVKNAIDQFRKFGRLLRPHLGMTVYTLDPSLVNECKQYFPLFPDNISEGVVINTVMAGSSAQKAGLRPGDVIISVDGKSVRSASDVFVENVGQRLELGVLRGNQMMDVTVVAGSRD